jgi:purine-binding chemotaxis protein CheW
MDAPIAAAPPSAPTSAREGTVKLVCFFLHGQEYGIDIADVVETLTVKPITKVFLTPAWLAGIMNLRGDVVPVLDLARLLGMAPTTVTGDSRIVLAERDELKAGLLVGGLAELRVVALADRESPPSTIPAEVGTLLAGVYTLEQGRALRVLDLESLFSSERLQTLDGLR